MYRTWSAMQARGKILPFDPRRQGTSILLYSSKTTHAMEWDGLLASLYEMKTKERLKSMLLQKLWLKHISLFPQGLSHRDGSLKQDEHLYASWATWKNVNSVNGIEKNVNSVNGIKKHVHVKKKNYCAGS